MKLTRQAQSESMFAPWPRFAWNTWGFFNIVRLLGQGPLPSLDNGASAFLHLFQLEDGQQLVAVGPIDDLSFYTTNRVKFCIQLNLEIVREKVASRLGWGDEVIEGWP